MDHAWQNFYGAATVGERGQVVIPLPAREALGIKPGDKILVLGGPFGRQGLLMIKAEAIGELLTHFSERLNDLEKLARISAEQQEKEDN